MHYIVVGIGNKMFSEDSYLIGVTKTLEEAIELAKRPIHVKINDQKFEYSEALVFKVGEIEAVFRY